MSQVLDASAASAEARAFADGGALFDVPRDMRSLHLKFIVVLGQKKRRRRKPKLLVEVNIVKTTLISTFLLTPKVRKVVSSNHWDPHLATWPMMKARSLRTVADRHMAASMALRL